MSKKHTVKKAVALGLGIALTVGATGCNFFVTDTQADLKQVVATVDITDVLAGNDDYKAYASQMETLMESGGLPTNIYKRELVAYFMSVGYNYVNNYGYSYEDTFNLLMDGLTGNKILTQYAVAYYLKDGADDGITAQACLDWVAAETNKTQGTEKKLLEEHPEVLTMKYFLTNGGKTTKEDLEDYNKAVYTLQTSINSSLDSAESNYIKEQAGGHTHDETRTTPNGINTTNEDYYPLKADNTIDYGVYTGRNSIPNNYETVDGSTATTRKKAYNMFIANLDGYGLIKDGEDTAHVTELDYYYVELSTALAQSLVNKYYESMKDEAIAKLSNNNYQYVSAKYDEIVKAQKAKYEKDATAFETDLGTVSDTSFVLYGQEGFGFVYNILIPFSSTQSQQYAAAKNRNLSEEELFEARKAILDKVQAKDLRGAWFCDDIDSTDHYAYEKEGNYYFFEDSIVNAGEDEKYKELTQYEGNYPFQGTATYDDDKEEWTVTPEKYSVLHDAVDAPSFITRFEEYVRDTVKEVKSDIVVGGNKNTDYGVKYYLDDDGNATATKTEQVNYNAFVYYTGAVELGTVSANDYFKRGTAAYKAVSAVNELMFAYSTDPGCLNTYFGYSVSPYKTNYVPEFEYAAQKAVSQGVGAYNLVATDYGWHLIYCSFAYDTTGAVYGADVNSDGVYVFNTDNIETEGTFEYMFYESLKSTAETNYTQDAQSKVLNQFKDSITLHTEKYKDLMELDK